jgi:hypothetical protein
MRDWHTETLARYEREQDAIQRDDDELAEIESAVWDDPDLLIDAIMEAPDYARICDAVAKHALRIFEQRRCDAEMARAEMRIDT